MFAAITTSTDNVAELLVPAGTTFNVEPGTTYWAMSRAMLETKGLAKGLAKGLIDNGRPCGGCLRQGLKHPGLQALPSFLYRLAIPPFL